jgi:Rieske Fe-S protein
VIPTRRLLLAQGACGLLGCAAVACGARAPKPADDSGAVGAGRDSAPASSDPCAPPPLGANSVLLSFAEYPALAAVGGSVAVTLDGASFRVARAAEDCAVAASATCTHEGCALNYDAGRFVCPCHGALFDLDGSVLGGPTPIPLPTRPAVVEADGVRVGPPREGR